MSYIERKIELLEMMGYEVEFFENLGMYMIRLKGNRQWIANYVTVDYMYKAYAVEEIVSNINDKVRWDYLSEED